MAEPLSRSGAIRLLEESVHVLRQAPASTWLCHPIGSVPFALGLLLAWNSVTNSRTSDRTWVWQSLVLALLLVWMNSWRSVFACRLRCQLSGVDDRPWTFARVSGMVVAQAFYGSTKLVVLPLAGLVMYWWADTIGVYRYLAVLAGRGELSSRQMLARARRLADFEHRQGWTILPILLFLWVAIALNLFLALGVLPQLVRILTGYETAFSRSGIFFALNPIFALMVVAVSWITFDPFVQAVYTVRCFQAESRETGEDLRSGLRRLRGAAALVVPAVLMLAAVPLRAEIAPADLQQSIRQAMQAPEYDWRLPPAGVAANTPWIVRITDRLVAVGRRIADFVGRTIDSVLRWLGDKLKKILPESTPGAPPAVSLHWTLALLIAILLAAAGMVWWQRRQARRPAAAAAKVKVEIRLDAADLSPDVLPEESWMELAERSLAEQNFLLALRAYYLASLAWLGRQEYLAIHPGKTNHEYSVELRRRTRAFPDARALFAENIAAFERAWYGEHGVTAEDAAAFRERARALKGLLERPAGVAA
jgi:hypothetical protein